MSVHRRQRANGREVWQVTWRDPDGRQRAESYATRRGAERRDREIRDLQARGHVELADAGAEPLRDAVESWWTDHVEPNLARATIASYAQVLDSHLLPRLGGVPIRDIDPARVIELQRQLRTDGVGGAMSHRVLMVLSGVLRHAVLRGRIDRNPIQPVRVAQPRRKRAIRPLAPASIERLRRELLAGHDRALSLVAEYGMRLASNGDMKPSEAIGQLLDYLPIYQFSGGAMTPLDADEVMGWATAGVGATALAQRWNSPVLVDVSQATLSALLARPDLLEALEQIEDFRTLANMAQQIVTSTSALKKAKREQGGKLDPDQRKRQSETSKQRKEIREKLQKFVAKVPVFMYMTDFREEALKDVIESLDSALFERVTGLTVEDFRLLNSIGVFNAQHMNSAIYQFKLFEHASLHYADPDWAMTEPNKIGLWDHTEVLDR